LRPLHISGKTVSYFPLTRHANNQTTTIFKTGQCIKFINP
jgi:hypothetical protein